MALGSGLSMGPRCGSRRNSGTALGGARTCACQTCRITPYRVHRAENWEHIGHFQRAMSRDTSQTTRPLLKPSDAQTQRVGDRFSVTGASVPAGRFPGPRFTLLPAFAGAGPFAFIMLAKTSSYEMPASDSR